MKINRWIVIAVLAIVGVTIEALDLNRYGQWLYRFGNNGIDAFQDSVDAFVEQPTPPQIDRL